MIPLPSLVISSSECMWPSSRPREIKRDLMRGPLEKVCSLFNNTGSLFPSAGRCRVCSGMTRTAVAARGYDPNNIATWQAAPSHIAPERVCMINRNGRWHVIWKIRLWETLWLPSGAFSFSWITHSGESQPPCPEDTMERLTRPGAEAWGAEWASLEEDPWAANDSSPGHQLNSWLQTHEWPWARTTQLATPRFQTCGKYDLIVFLLLSS